MAKRENLGFNPEYQNFQIYLFMNTGEMDGAILADMVPGLDKQEMIQLWQDGLLLIYNWDKQIDHYAEDLSQRESVVQQALQSFDQDEIPDIYAGAEEAFKRIRARYRSLSPERKAYIQATGRRMFQASEKKREATTPDRYAKCLAVEGAVSADFVLNLIEVSPEQKEDFLRFSQWIRMSAAISNFSDAAIDFHQDRINNLISTELSALETRLFLAKKFIAFFVISFPLLDKKSALWAYVKMRSRQIFLEGKNPFTI